MMKPLFRQAQDTDLPAVADILAKAVETMLAEGKKQWTWEYPNAVHVRADIAAGRAFVLESEGRVVGYAAVVLDGEPAYADIDGEWQGEGPYVAAHRFAVLREEKRRGLGLALLSAIEEYGRGKGAVSFRIDTNYDNTAMLGLLRKAGFGFRGEVRYPQGKRLAFEKLL